LPRRSHPSVRLALKPRGSALPVAPLDEVAGCPASCIFRRCRTTEFRVASTLLSFGASGGEAQVTPHFTPSVAPADTFHGLPRFLHLPALPATSPRVTPQSASFGASGAGALGRPSASHFPLRLSVVWRVSSRCHLPALPRVQVLRLPRGLSPLAPADRSPSCLGSRTFRLAVPASSGFPESCIYGWVDDDFPVLLELCILGWAADESS